MVSLTKYMREHQVDRPLKADVALALLRMNTPDSLAEAERLLGIKIKRCPPAVPPWPPKPAPTSKVKKVLRVGPSPYAAGSAPEARFKSVRVGMTVDQLHARGVSDRDVAQWRRQGLLEIR